MEGKIERINIGVTNRCNLRCTMCDIWKELPKRDIPISIISELLDSKLLSDRLDITITGGEPFLYGQLHNVTSVILDRRPDSLRTISTNGTMLKEMLLYFDEFIKRLPEGFSLHVSLDGMNSHDAQRGVICCSKIQSNIGVLREKYPDMDIRIKFTITRENYADIVPTWKFCQDNRLVFRPKLVEDASNYTNKIKRLDSSLASFTISEKRNIIKALFGISSAMKSKSHSINSSDTDFIHEMILRLSGKKIFKACRAPFSRIFIMPDSDVYSCIHFDAIGNIALGTLDEIFLSQKNISIREQVVKNGCNHCVSYHGRSI